jgi:type II secretory pathway component PulF
LTQFERALQGRRDMQPRLRQMAYAMLVEGVPTGRAAEAAGVKQPQASRTKARVLEWHMQAQGIVAQDVKVSAEEFMARKPLRTAQLEALRPELAKLQRAGYPLCAMLEFVAANDVQATAEDVQKMLGPISTS